MATRVETIENAFNLEPETDADIQAGTTVADDSATETQPTQEISHLWSNHARLSGDRQATTKELRQIRAALAERLHEMKSLLSRPGRLGQWRGWLKQQAIPRSTADRLASRHAETLGYENENVPTGATPEPAEAAAAKLAKAVWQRFRKALTTEEAVVQFIGSIAEMSGIAHEWREEGLMVFHAVPKPAGVLPGSACATDPASQPSDEAPAIKDEPGEETAIRTLAMEQVAGDGDNCAGAAA